MQRRLALDRRPLAPPASGLLLPSPGQRCQVVPHPPSLAAPFPAAAAPVDGYQCVQDGQAGGRDCEEDVRDGPAEVVREDVGLIGPFRTLDDLAHDGADAGNRADGKEEADAEFAADRDMLEAVENYQRDC